MLGRIYVATDDQKASRIDSIIHDQLLPSTGRKEEKNVVYTLCLTHAGSGVHNVNDCVRRYSNVSCNTGIDAHSPSTAEGRWSKASTNLWPDIHFNGC